MTKNLLWSNERVMARYRAFIECNGAEYANIAWQSVVLEMIEEYEAEIERLRARLPGPAVREAIRDMTDDAAQTDYDDKFTIDVGAVSAWLYSLAEKEVEDEHNHCA